MTALGRTGLATSRLGIGTWTIGGGNYEPGRGTQDDAASEAMLHQALAARFNWIDTAPAYGLGRAEGLVGRRLEGVAGRPLIFTRCSRLRHEDGPSSSCRRRDSIRRELEGSPWRLKTDCIDLYQIHRPWPEENLPQGREKLAELMREGLARHIGMSDVIAPQLRLPETIAPVKTLLPEDNLLSWDIERDVRPHCAAHDIGVMAYSLMASAMLTGTFSAQRLAQLPEDDRRKHGPQYAEPALSAKLRVVDAATPDRTGARS